jgi:hypothetical protein
MDSECYWQDFLVLVLPKNPALTVTFNFDNAQDSVT